MLQYLIVCPLVSLAGLVGSTTGDDRLATLPAYLIAGAPAHVALDANKLNSAMGATVSAARLAKHGFFEGKVLMAVCSSAAALMGSALGAHLALIVPGPVIKHVMIVVLSVVVLYVLRSKGIGAGDRTENISKNKVLTIPMTAAPFAKGYSGFCGPGIGTLLILILAGAVGMGARSASTQAKVINLSSGIATSVAFIATGDVYYPPGLIAGVCSIAGHYIGVDMVARDGQKVVRPVIPVVLRVLFIKITSNT